ncbi:uracil-DNA glycosylase-like protein [Ephemerocybe angulata]|uniref:Uracil-DNA glycosylase n=1 Tax=Ephemerocybe angulata TaxID=980116 RepID=A0A8H6I1I4_9AGAR|nr:uracil-DNA glycosylase-like protein [Tulosesus angulatus]
MESVKNTGASSHLTAKRKASEPPEHVDTEKAEASRGTKIRTKTTIDAFFTPSGVRTVSQSSQKKQKTGSGASRPTTAIPTATSQRPKLNSIPFSKNAFQTSLTDEEKNLLKLECDTLALSWLKLLKDEIRKPYFLDLKRFLWDAGLKSSLDTPPSLQIYPPPKDIYTWSKTPLGKVKAVIIGQDPYHGPGQAHGLCFSVPHGVKIPPSLLNIYQELKTEYPDFIPPKHGNLISWANTGVLLLNTCLTVKAKAAGSHSRRGWERFTEKVIDVVDQYGGANLPNGPNGSESTGIGRGIVFLAWGAWAAERVSKLDKSKHLILTSAHPSPYSADRGFFGNGHFVKANAWLEERYGPGGRVEWCAL